MYTSFFGLNEKPFSITPDPRYLYMSERHTEALAHLLYGVRESGGFIQLTGEVGTGKTTLVRSLLQQVPETADVALILNPQLSRTEFLQTICEELGIATPQGEQSVKSLTGALNGYLLANHRAGKRTIVIVDEAQNLRLDVLEQVRLLTNLETATQKLLQIILIGQPELRDLLARNDMRQLAQRITGRYHLEPLSRDETIDYIDHRLKVAGGAGPIFTARAKRELYRLSGGVPRMINVIADRTLLGAFSEEARQITPRTVRRAAGEVFDRPALTLNPWYNRMRYGSLALASAAVLAAAAWTGVSLYRAAPAAQAVPPAAAAPAAAPAEPAAPPLLTGGAPAEPLVPLGEALASRTDRTSTDIAFETLFGMWGAEYQRGPLRACKQAQAFNLHCLFQRGSLSVVRHIDRPAILTLRDTNNQQHQVVLAALGDEHAELRIGGEPLRVSIADLSEYWFGEYLLLWRPQIGRVKSLLPGMRDEDVRWLRESLAAIQGSPVAPMSSDFYDGDLEARVKDYQRQRRLNVDGLVGQRTQIAINTDLAPADTPRLSKLN